LSKVVDAFTIKTVQKETKMKNLKAHHHLAIISMLCFGVVSVWAWGTVVFAGTTNTQINVYVGPPDSCPNIPGYQMGVPNGMEVDGSGNCYTPPPPPVDNCNNIDGTQTAVPNGYYQDANGACKPQPTPPVDVCPNLSGTQTTVPDGYSNAANGDCVLPPVDVCNNIDGPQYLVPEEMTRTGNGVCFTPSPIVTPPPATPPSLPDTPRQPAFTNGRTDLKNIPDFLDGALAPLVNAIPESVKEALRSVPPIVAQTFPYYVFGVLGIGAAALAWQTAIEIAAAQKLGSLLKRERDIAEEKDNFIALASHYLRTPLALMTSSLDTIRATHESDDVTMAPLKTAVLGLDTKIGEILADVEGNTALNTISTPKAETNHFSFTRTAFFWVPVVTTVLVTLLANFMLGVVGNVELGTSNLFAQVAVFITVSLLFYSALRSRHLRRRERAYKEKLVSHEQAIDAARNNFISLSGAALLTSLNVIKDQSSIIAGTRGEPYFKDGYERFEHLLQKFSLLGQIQTGVVGAVEKFNINTAIDDIIAFYKPQLDAKRITVINNVKSSNIKQRRTLFDFVLGSLIDNAIKFSHDGGTITVVSTPHEGVLTLKVSDYGIGIPEEKMSQLFKPFSRSTSALEFNYEGLGFSLFLDKIIMDYMGGEISARSEDHKHTTFTVVTASTPS